MTSLYKHGRGLGEANKSDLIACDLSAVLQSGEAIGVAASPPRAYTPLSFKDSRCSGKNVASSYTQLIRLHAQIDSLSEKSRIFRIDIFHRRAY